MKHEPGQDELAGRVRLPKLNGADTEFGNLVQGLETNGPDTCREASRALLQEFAGLPRVSKRHAFNCRCDVCRSDDDYDKSRDDPLWAGGGNGSSGWGYLSAPSNQVQYDPQDLGRRFLPENGACAYIDMNHLELALPEVLSARDHVAATHAMLRLLGRAMNAANAKLPEGQRLVVLANNSDGLGNSYGGHLNVLVSRRCWDDVMNRKPHYLGYLSSYQASSIVITGQGKVGSENGRPAADFQLSQRADFFETLIGPQTTYRRPLVNSRDETLCGQRGWFSAQDNDSARLHCIFYDTNLSHVALFLKVGMMQLVLALLEAGQVNPRLILDDPLEAVWSWSSDPSLQARATLADGSRLTAVEMQQHYLEEARGFHAKGGFSGIVPDAGEILELWESTLRLLAVRDMPALAQRLDWALKLSLLERALESHPELSWASPALKHLDLLYSSLDAEEGLYWIYQRAGLTERIVDDERVDWFTTHPPEDTRAWTRAMLLRRAGGEQIDDVDWDRIRFRSGSGWATRYRRLEMPEPLGLTRQATASVFDEARSLDELIDLLGGDAPTVTLGGFTTSPGAA